MIIEYTGNSNEYTSTYLVTGLRRDASCLICDCVDTADGKAHWFPLDKTRVVGDKVPTDLSKLRQVVDNRPKLVIDNTPRPISLIDWSEDK